MDYYLQANINQQYTQLLVMANCFQSEEEYQDSIKAFLERFEENERKEIINFLLVQFPNIRCIQEIQMEILNREGCVKKGIEVAFKAVQVIYTPARSKFEVVREYNKAKLANNSISILQLLDNENFLKYMEFPGCIRNIREIIVNLKQDGLKVFDIVERCQEPSLSINRNLLLDILYFVFNCPQINQTDLIRLLKFFGSVTCKFIIQFQQQLQELQINDKDILNQLIEQLQSVQIGQIEIEMINQIRKHSPEMNLIVIIATMNTNNALEFWYQQIQNILQKTSSNSQQLYQEALDAVILNINGQASLIYFLTLFILWYLSCQDEMVQYNYIKRNKEKGKIKSIINSAQRNEKDQLIRFLLGKLYCFNEQFEELEQNLETLIKQQWISSQALQNQEIERPNQLFHYPSLFKIQILMKNISPMTLSKIFQDKVKILKLMQTLQLINEVQLEKAVQFFIDHISQKKVDDITHYLSLSQQQSNFTYREQSLFFLVFCEYFDFEIRDFKLLNKFIPSQISQVILHNYLTISYLTESSNINPLITEFQNFSEETWDFIIKFIDNKTAETLSVLLINFYFSNLPQSPQFILFILKKFNLSRIEEKYQALQTILQNTDYSKLHQIFIDNCETQLSFIQYWNTNEFILDFISQLELQENKILKDFILLFQAKFFYELDFIWILNSNKVDKKIIKDILELIFLEKVNDQYNLTEKASNFSNQFPQHYQELLRYFPNFEDSVLCNFQKKIQYDIFPRGGEISLEEFNISLALMTEQEQVNLVDQWVNNMNNAQYFKKLIPFFFNILKRGEKIKGFLQLINQSIKRNNIQKQSGFFNLKALFQIFYNNSNPELQVMLLKLQSKNHPIPLIQRQFFEQGKGADLLSLNANAFYVFQKSYTIINFCLNQKQNRIGKTELINRIFYQMDKFEICDNCQLNTQTIDIMSDYSFNGSRNLTIADAHDYIPLNILDKVLPLFRLWLIQVDGESEIQKMLEQLTQLTSFDQKDKRKIFLLIRNSQFEDLTEDLIIKLTNYEITYLQIEDLTNKDLNKQMIESEIQSVAKTLYQFISKHYKSDEVSQNEFLQLIDKDIQSNVFKKEFESNLQIITQLNQELENFINLSDGFYNSNAFPIRHIEFKIKELKKQYSQISINSENEQQQKELQQINDEIKKLEQQIQLQKPTKILELFCQIFEKKKPIYIIFMVCRQYQKIQC